MLAQAKPAALAMVLCGFSAASAAAQSVDLPSSRIYISSPPVLQAQAQAQAGLVRPVQDQVPQPPDQAAPLTAPRAAPLTAPQAAPQAVPPQNLGPNQLNADPNANINDLMPPQAPTPPAGAQNFDTGRSRGLGATAGSYSSAPNMVGDFFGAGLSAFGGSQTVSFSGYSAGTILSGSPGSANSTLAFEFGSDTAANDIFTMGTGSDLAGIEGGADSFAIAEPLPPNDALTSPGPGFSFDGGTAVYTNNNTSTTPQPGIYQDGERWYVSYSYTQSLADGANRGGRAVPGPGVAVRRVKISENFSPEVRDRCFASYNFFNDALGGLGDVSRYTLGVERILVDDLISVEARLPMAGTYASTQALDQVADRDFEFGNAAIIMKGVLLRGDRFIWSGGLGVTLPLSDDTRISSGGQELLRVENETVHVLPFMGLLLRKSPDTSIHGFMQLDVAANGDPVYGDLTGGPLPKIGVFNDSTLLYLDVATSHVIYRDQGRRFLKQLIANGEIHYSGTLQDADFVQRGNLNYTNLKRNFNVVNATAGLHFVLNNDLVVTPAMSVPLRDGLDEQFDYEAIVHLNYFR